MSTSSIPAAASVVARPAADPAALAKRAAVNVGTPADGAAPVNLVRAAVQEATETAAQTVREANGGDRQAQRVLAKVAAAHPVTNSSGQLTGTLLNTKA